MIFFHDVYSYMPKLEACANKTNTGVSTTSTCRDRPKMKTKLLLSFGKKEFFFMMFILICQNSKHVQKKTYTGISTISTCRDRPKLKTKLLLSFGKNEFFFMMFILICQNSKHVQKKTYTGV